VGPPRPIEHRLHRQLRAVHKAYGLFRVRSESSIGRVGPPRSTHSCHAVVLRIEGSSYRLRRHADLVPTFGEFCFGTFSEDSTRR
jgi:hypothetical protein